MYARGLAHIAIWEAVHECVCARKEGSSSNAYEDDMTPRALWPRMQRTKIRYVANRARGKGETEQLTPE